jgi:isopentenyl-diphosphate Delta-isomerase
VAEEYLDVVDENNRVIGREARSVIHRTGLWHRGVHIFLFTPDRKLLVQERSLQQLSPNMLDCSVSEHLKTGEDYPDAAKRGLREELGIESILLKQVLQFKMNYGPNDNIISALYEGTIDREKIIIDKNEVAKIMYYSLPQLEELYAQGEASFSRWFLQLLLWYWGKPSDICILEKYQ